MTTLRPEIARQNVLEHVAASCKRATAVAFANLAALLARHSSQREAGNVDCYHHCLAAMLRVDYEWHRHADSVDGQLAFEPVPADQVDRRQAKETVMVQRIRLRLESVLPSPVRAAQANERTPTTDLTCGQSRRHRVSVNDVQTCPDKCGIFTKLSFVALVIQLARQSGVNGMAGR